MTRKPHPSSRARRKKDEPDDAFVAWILQTWSWAQNNSQSLILGSVALILVVAGSIYYVSFRQTLEERGMARLESIQQTIGMGQQEQAREELVEFLDQFGETDLAAEASLLLGEIQLQGGQPRAAVETLEPVAGSLGRPIALQAAFLKAQAHEELGEWERAVEEYLRVANRSELSFQINDALMAAARIRTRTGDLAGAADLYQELLDTLEEGAPDRGVVELRLAEIRARMEA